MRIPASADIRLRVQSYMFFRDLHDNSGIETINFLLIAKNIVFLQPLGKMAERSNAAVLKTVDLRGSGGSNPSLSAEKQLTFR